MANDQLRNKEEASLLSDIEGTRGSLESNDFPQPHSRCASRFKITSIALTVSIIINIILASLLIFSRHSPSPPASHFASLTRARTEPYVMVTPYTSSNTSLAQQLWEGIDVDAGVVALSDEYAAAHGLRTAQRFPWDTSKGIYILHGYHNLHCVKIVHLALDEFRSGRPQSRHWEHVEHCVDALRRQVLCDADDTPRATERRKEVVSGVGQHRQCRSWDALESWAKKHTACYRRPEMPGDERGMRRFMHCPEGSGYVVREDYVPTEEILEGLPAESIQGIEDLVRL